MRISQSIIGAIGLCAALLSSPVFAEQPPSGFVQLDYIANRPEAGVGAENSNGYDVTVAYKLQDNLAVLGEYAHLPHPFSGFSGEDDYAIDLKHLIPLNDSVSWITELAYEEGRVTGDTASITVRGYDLAGGLQIVLGPRLGLEAELEHSNVGGTTNAIDLGVVKKIGSHFGFEGIIQHSQSNGTFANTYYLGWRVYY